MIARLPIAFCLLLHGAQVAPAGEVLDQIEAIIRTYEDSVRANTMKMIQAKSDEDKARYRASVPSVEPYAPQVMALVKSHRENPDVVRGVTWLVIQATSTPEGQQALELLGTEFVAASDIAEAVKRLEYQPLEIAKPIIGRVLAENTHDEPRAAALFALGMVHFRRSSRDTTSADAAASAFQHLVDGFPETKVQGFVLADQASRMLFELTRLAEGSEAPEIEGMDAKGVPFKLSDYRGKHVVLCFWGGWCHACHGILPILNNLHTETQGKPVAILGINTDHGESGAEALTKFDVRFRNWLDGSTSGPITSLYNLRNFPTLYMIDDQGMILKKNPTLDQIRAQISDPQETSAPAKQSSSRPTAAAVAP